MPSDSIMYVIESRGSQGHGARIVNPATMEVLRFATRREARAHRDEIKSAQPSKYLPLVVTKEKS